GDQAPVAREMMPNLVVVSEWPLNEPVDLARAAEHLPLIEVAQHHPSRVIVLAHARCDDQRGPAAARVDVLTFSAHESRFGVEQIVVRSTCADRSLCSIVRRLILGDLPTSVWWTGDLSRQPMPLGLVEMAQ